MSPRKIVWEVEECEPPPRRTPPPEGWHPITCTWESHQWTLDVEDGRAFVACADPCEPLHDPAGPIPVCLCEWQPEDLFTPDSIPVRLVYVDDSTPSTPAGPAEYGFYIEVHPR